MNKKNILFFLFFSTLSLQIFAQTNKNITLLGKWGSGSGRAVSILNNIMFVGSSDMVYAVNLSDTLNPVELGFIVLGDTTNNISLTQKNVFVATNSGLRIIDASIPSAMKEIGFLPTMGKCLAVSVSDNFAFISDTKKGLRIINISNPSSPFELTSFALSDTIQKIFIKDAFAFLACGSTGMKIIDFQNISSPIEIGNYNTEGFTHSLFIKDTIAYLADGANGIELINIAVPNNPQLISSFKYNSTPIIGLIIKGKTLYAIQDYFYTLSIDISNPAFPILKGKTSDYYNLDIAISENDLLAVAESEVGVHFSSVTDPSFLDHRGFFHTKISAQGIIIKDSIAFVSDASKGLRIIDFKNPHSPKQIGFVATPPFGNELALHKNYIYCVTTYDGLQIIDIADLTKPKVIGSLKGNYSSTVKTYGDSLFLLGGEGIFSIFDIKLPTIPVNTLNIKISNYSTSGLAINDIYAYIVDSRTIQMRNIKNPSIPLMSSLDSLGDGRKVTAKGNYVFVADAWKGLKIYDVSLPSKIKEISSINGDFSAFNVTVVGDYAFVAGYYGGVRIIDISNITLPKEVGYFTTNNPIISVAVIGDIIIAADIKFGLYFLENNLLSSVKSEQNPLLRKFLLAQNYPNPFNPETKIEYYLARNEFVTLKVFDILGKTTQTLVQEYQINGSHTIIFNASKLTSGIYFYQLNAGPFQETRKMIFMK